MMRGGVNIVEGLRVMRIEFNEAQAKKKPDKLPSFK